jgi:hypothetical protein
VTSFFAFTTSSPGEIVFEAERVSLAGEREGLHQPK